MSKIYCSNCGAEVILPKESTFAMGMTIAENTKGDYVMQTRDSKGRFAKSEAITTEYENENTTNNTNKENEVMNNNMNMNFDMETLAKMVAAQLSGQVAEQKVVTNNVSNVTPGVADKNGWAKNSQFYGKEICGYAFNPYMVRRFLPKQFENLMNRYNNVVFTGIDKEYPYMYSINYTLEEVRKLAMLYKRDKIAYDERSNVFRLEDCKQIFAQYIDDIIRQLEDTENEFIKTTKVGKEVSIGLKGYGWTKLGVVSERIENHKVVRYIEKSDDYKRVLADLNDISNKLKNWWNIRSYKDLYETMSKVKIKVKENRRKSRVFIDCFIKGGAYYTLKQMLMFDNSVKFRGFRGREAVVELRKELDNKNIKGYMIYAMLKEVKGIR